MAAAPPSPVVAVPKLHEAAEGMLRLVFFHPDENKSPQIKCAEVANGLTAAAPPAFAVQRCNAIGLQSPMWVWTHRAAMTQADCVAREAAMCFHLSQWFASCGVDMRRVVVVTNRLAAAAIRERISTATPTDQERLQHAQIEAFDAGAATTEMQLPDNSDKILIVAIGLKSNSTHGKLMAQSEPSIARWLHAPRDSKPPAACVFVCDAGWAVNTHWPHMVALINKLSKESRRASGTSNMALTYGSLVHSRLPVCCPMHPNERAVVSGVDAITGVCPRLCLKHFKCRDPAHRCLQPCHPSIDHAACPFMCNKTLACGHECRMQCSVPCNCLTIVEEPLPCFHEIATHLDAAQQPVFARVPHVFRGTCTSLGDVCCAVVQVLCANCGGKFEEQCHVVHAANHGNAEGQRTLVCPTCNRRERKIRSECRAELIRVAEEKKKELKSRLKDELFQQRRAASSGVFQVGQKVVILDASKVVDPLTPEDDFPGIIFCTTTDVAANSHGVVVREGAADITDLSEFQYCVRLATGKCALVMASGLQLIRSAYSALGSSCGNGGGGAPRPLLMIGALPTSGTDTKEAEEGTDGTAAALAPPVGSLCLLVHELCVDSGAGTSNIVVRNAVVEVVSETFLQRMAAAPNQSDSDDAAFEAPPVPHVRVRCIQTDFSAAAEVAAREAAARAAAAAATGDEQPTNRVRTEGVASPAADGALAGEDMRAALPSLFDATVLEFAAPVAHLELVAPLGGDVIVAQPSAVVAHPAERKLLNSVIEDVANVAPMSSKEDEGAERCGGVRAAALRELKRIVALDKRDRVAAHPIGMDEPCTVRGVLNWPISPLHDHGPVFLLELKRAPPTPQHHRPGARWHQATSAYSVRRFIAVPVVFVAVDDEVSAEATLDKEILDRLEAMFAERFARDVDERQLVNAEVQFVEQQRLGKQGVAGAAKVPAEAFSIPKPLMSEQEAAKHKTAFAHLQHHNETLAKLAVKKDSLMAKRDAAKVDADFWAKATEQLDREQQALKMWIESVRREIVGIGASRR